MPHAKTTIVLRAAALLLLGGSTSIADFQLAPGGAEKTEKLRPAVPPPNGDWPCWRGPGSLGIRSTALAVTQWSESKGVRWKVALPGQGHASPIIFGEQVFVSTADERAQTQALVAYHRSTGKLQWNTVFYRGRFPSKNAKNSHASPTPVCDGAHVYIPSAADGAVWLTAIDLAGKIAWQRRLGPFVSEWGYASSPALHKDMVIVVGDNKGSPGAADSCYMVAVQRKTGEVVWRVPRPLIPSYGTPVVAHLAGRDQLLISGAERIVAYDPADGKEIWSFRWGASRSANSMVCGPDCVYASTTWRENQILCVRADGTGDVTDSHLVWKHARTVTDIPSPLFHEGRLYLTTDRGLAVCMDGATGKTIWQNRLGGAISASPVLAGETIVSVDESGNAHLFKASRKFELLGTSSLSDRVLASPALAGDCIFLRGMNYLYCLDGQTVGPPVVANLPATPRAYQKVEQPVAIKARPPQVPLPAPRDDDIPWWFWVAAGILGVLTLLALMVIVALLLSDKMRQRQNAPVADCKEPKTTTQDPPTLLVVVCAGCAKNLKVKRQLAGKKVKCPHCGKAVLVPGGSANAVKRIS